MNEIIENKKKSEILADRISELDYGTVITHQQIASLIEEEYPSNKYSSTIAKTRKILLKKYNRVIENIPGDGYRVVNPGGFVDQSLKHYKRGFSQMQKGFDTLTYAPTKDMTQEELVNHRRVHDRAVILQASMQGVKAELKVLAKKDSPFNPKYIGRP